MLINNNINSKTYRIDKKISISFIEDLQSDTIYILKNEISNLWNFIINNKDLEKSYKYAQENSLINELTQLLSELNQKKLIKTNNNIIKPIKYLKNAINKKSKNYKYFQKKKEEFIISNKFLDTLFLELNYSCNLNCIHCCNPKNINEEKISFKIAKKIIDEAIELGISAVVLTGGECTINKDFFRIAKYVREKYLELHILTNAQNFYDNKKLLQNIINIAPTEIQISLYSMIEDNHDKFTKVEGSHNKAITVIKELRKNNINTVIACFISSHNYKDYKDIKVFADNIGAKITIDCKFINNPANKNINIKLNLKEITNFYRENIDINNIRNNSKCSGGIDRISITPQLNITPCVYFNSILGNYNFVSLKEIRKKLVSDFHKELKRKNENQCKKYDYCKYCYYCPTYAINGFMKKSHILCEDAKAYKQALEIKKRKAKI